jgi:uncharacterized protein YgbK (DUF1537 family)
MGHGFAEIALDAASLAGGARRSGGEAKAAAQAIGLLSEGRHVILHTSPSARKPPTKSQRGDLKGTRRAPAGIRAGSGEILGRALGRILERILQEVKIKRLVVAGGDTAGHVARQIGVESLEMIGELTPGSPLCRVHAPRLPADGLEVTFKGGQIGKIDFFGLVAVGRQEAMNEWQ